MDLSAFLFIFVFLSFSLTMQYYCLLKKMQYSLHGEFFILNKVSSSGKKQRLEIGVCDDREEEGERE
jgi:hypothetical protein